MKSYYIFVFFLLLFQLGCEKDNIEEYPEWSKVKSLKNGKYWEVQAYAFTRQTKTLSIPVDRHDENGFRREGLSLGNVDLSIGKQIIPGSLSDTLYAKYTTFMADGDVVEDRFVLLEDEENFLDIWQLNFDKMEMNGIFQLTFVRDMNDPITNPNLPDTICFTEGEFHLKIINGD